MQTEPATANEMWGRWVQSKVDQSRLTGQQGQCGGRKSLPHFGIFWNLAKSENFCLKHQLAIFGRLRFLFCSTDDSVTYIKFNSLM